MVLEPVSRAVEPRDQRREASEPAAADSSTLDYAVCLKPPSILLDVLISMVIVAHFVKIEDDLPFFQFSSLSFIV